MSRLARIEVWDKLRKDSGTRQGFVRDRSSPILTRKLDGLHELRFTVPVETASYLLLAERRVIRLTYEDDTWEEFRIKKIREVIGAAVATAAVEAEAPLGDLASVTIIGQTDSTGHVEHDFEAIGLTLAEHIDTFILPALTAAGYTGITRGTIDNTTIEIDIAYAWDTPLSALRRMCETAKLELDYVRNGTTGYIINLRTAINASSVIPSLRTTKNIPSLTRERSSVEQVTRIYPRGGQRDVGYRATLGGAKWQVGTVVSNTITLLDPSGGPGPIAFNNQFATYRIKRPNGTTVVINSTVASTDSLTLASTPSIVPGDFVEIVTAASADVTFLDAPADVSTYGVKVAVLSKDDIPGTVNLVKNPTQQAWSGSSSQPPDSWAAVGSPTLTRTTTSSLTRVGGKSTRVVTSTVNLGLETAYVKITPTALHPYVSGFISSWLVSGEYRVELILSNGSTTWTFPNGTSQIANNNETLRWKDIGVSGIDAFALGATQAKIRLVKNGTTGSLDVYVDAAQITTQATQEAFIAGSGPVQLWQAGNNHLIDFSLPMVRYEFDFVDLYHLDPVRWPYEQIVIGGSAKVFDALLGVDVTTRVVEYSQDLDALDKMSVALSSRPEDFTDTASRARRRQRGLPDDSGPTYVPQISFVSIVVTPDGVSSGVDLVTVSGAVDDFAQSLQWRLGTGSWTTITPLNLVKNFEFSFSVADGVRQSLSIKPFSGLNATGVGGNTFNQDFERTPRTVCVTEHKTPSGAASNDTLRLLFSVSPTFVVEDTGTNTGVSATTLTDTGQAWTVGQFVSNTVNRSFHYVEVTSGAFIGAIARITDNTATVLTLEGWSTTPTGTFSYKIKAGGTKYRRTVGGLTPPSDLSGFTPVASVTHISASLTGDIIEFFSEIDGVAPESPKRVFVDADDLPAVKTLSLTEASASVLTVSATFDDDARWWSLYLKKGGWPTLDGLSTGTVDPVYHKDTWDVSIASFSQTAGSATWYAIAIPLNSNGIRGARKTASLAVAGSPTAALSGISVVENDNGSIAYNKIGWSHNSLISDSTTLFSVTVGAYRQDNGPASEVDITSGATRRPWQDVGANFVNSDDVNTASGIGSILHAVPNSLRGDSSNGVQRTWVYTVRLYNSSLVLIGTYAIQHTDYYQEDIPNFIESAVTTTFQNGGACGGPDYKGNFFIESGYKYIIEWGEVSTENPAYRFDIYKATDAAGTAFVYHSTESISATYKTIAEDGVAASTPGSGEPATLFRWRYRVDIINISTGATVQSIFSTQGSATLEQCTGEPL